MNVGSGRDQKLDAVHGASDALDPLLVAVEAVVKRAHPVPVLKVKAAAGSDEHAEDDGAAHTRRQHQRRQLGLESLHVWCSPAREEQSDDLWLMILYRDVKSTLTIICNK